MDNLSNPSRSRSYLPGHKAGGRYLGTPRPNAQYCEFACRDRQVGRLGCSRPEKIRKIRDRPSRRDQMGLTDVAESLGKGFFPELFPLVDEMD